MVVGSGCWFVGRSSRILHYHDRLARSPNLSRSGSNRAFRPLRKSGNAGIPGIDGKRRPIRESESQSISLRGLRRLTSWFSFFRVFRGTSLPLRADSGPGDSEQDGKAERTWRGVAEPRRSRQGVIPGPLSEASSRPAAPSEGLELVPPRR